jgi:hypothetical protein
MLKYIVVINSVVWLHTLLGPYWYVCGGLFRIHPPPSLSLSLSHMRVNNWLIPPDNHIKPFLHPTEEYSHSTPTRHRVDPLHTFTTLHLHVSQVIPKLSRLHNRPRQTHSHIYTPYKYMNNLYRIFIESSGTAYGRDIIHIYLLYMIQCCYNNYFIL